MCQIFALARKIGSGAVRCLAGEPRLGHPRLCERYAKARKFGKDHCIEKGCRHDRRTQRGAIDRQGVAGMLPGIERQPRKK